MIGIGKKFRRVFPAVLMLVCSSFLATCKSSGGVDILGPSDETADAAAIVIDANKDLKAIKALYEKNETKREDLKKAMSEDNATEVKKIADDVVYIINDGVEYGKGALDKIEKAREMNVNSDYAEYLRLKADALQKQMEAFEQYRQAAIKLRNDYDPKNARVRDAVKADFKDRSDKFSEKMDKARNSSNEANELAKEVMKKPPE